MSERFPPIKPSDLTSEQKEAYDHMSHIAEKFFGEGLAAIIPHHTSLITN
jgi:hypothetical protein